MKYEYDQETDTLLITLAKGKPDFGEQSGDIITHYNKHGKPIEIELLRASKTALQITQAILSKNKLTA
ncbi:MAG TPA: DUF2283 domain-containing protein [archaeon]|nr:DUF2283 domain-containing protein [archaeon]